MSESNYAITFEKDEKIFPYNKCNFQDVVLKRFFELPQNVQWSEPKISRNKKLAAAKCQSNGNKNETYYIWSINESAVADKPIYSYTHSSILTFDFSPSSTSFIIVYKGKPPVHYNAKSGHKICELQLPKGNSIKNALAWSFSPQGRFFALGTDEHFFVWDVLSSELKLSFKDTSPKKYLRNNILVSVNNINDDVMLSLININENNKIYQGKIPNIKICNEILACMINSDNDEIYYATKRGIYKLRVSDNEIEDVLSFEETNPDKVFISSDCHKYFTTDYSTLNFWEEKKGLNMSVQRQKFNNIFVSLDSTMMSIVDDTSITFQDYSLLGQERDLFTIYTDLNPSSFKGVKYSGNSLVALCLINEQSAALYSCDTGELLHKWVNRVPYWGRALEIAPVSASPCILATKTSETLIEVWDYTKGIPVAPLKGFNAYDIKFNDMGNLLIAGTMGGNEVARIWDLEEVDKPTIFKTPGNEKNNKTTVYLTSNQEKLICHSVNQGPIIFDAKTKTVLYKLKSDFKFTSIDNIICSEYGGCFLSYGTSKDKIKIGVIWNYDKGEKVKLIDQCTIPEFSENGQIFMYKYNNEYRHSEDKLVIWNVEENAQLNGFEIKNVTASNYQILNDSISFMMDYKISDKEHKFTIHNIATGDVSGTLIFTQKSDEYYELYLYIDIDDNVNLRRLMFDQSN